MALIAARVVGGPHGAESPGSPWRWGRGWPPRGYWYRMTPGLRHQPGHLKAERGESGHGYGGVVLTPGPLPRSHPRQQPRGQRAPIC